MNIATPDVLQTINSPALAKLPLSPSTAGSIPSVGETSSSAGETGNHSGNIVHQFKSLLHTLHTAVVHTPDPKEVAARKKAEDAASGLVANALILPVLKQLRRSAWGGEGVFSGGIGEKTFGPEFDMQLADRIAQSPRLGIKVALADRMMKKGPPPAARKNGLDVHG